MRRKETDRKNEPENNNWTNEVVHNAAEQEAQHKKGDIWEENL